MATLFAGNEGKIVALSRTGMPAVVKINGLTGYTRLLVSGLGFGQQANVQFMHTLRDSIYIYVFGEKMGMVQVKGLLVLRACQSGSPPPVDQVMKYYQDQSVSKLQKNKGKPISISVASQVLKGYLVGIKVGGFNAQFGTAQFTLTYASLPMGESAGSDDGGINTIGGSSRVTL